MDSTSPGNENNMAADELSDEEYDLLNSETFGDDQEAFDWDAFAEGYTKSEEISPDSKLDVKEDSKDDVPDDPAIISMHSTQAPGLGLLDNLDSIYGNQSPLAYPSNIDSLLDPAHDIWGSPLTAGSFVTATDRPDIVRDANLSKSFETPTLITPTKKKDASQETKESAAPMPVNAMTVEELERQYSSEQSSQTPPTSSVSIPSHINSPGLLSQSASSHNPMYRPPVGTQTQLNGGPVYPPSHMPFRMEHRLPRAAVYRHPPQRGMQDPQMYRMMRGAAPQPYPMRYGNMPPNFRPRNMQHSAMAPPVLRYGNNVPPQRARMMGPQGMNIMNQHQMQQLQQQMYNLHMQQQMHGAAYPRDEYAGLLTKQEKDWLIKIQMLQLHTDDPYTDDYYYTIYNIEKNDESDDDSLDDGDSSSKFVLPAMAKLETRTYTPMQFEGSLGRLTSSSVHKPRQVLDVGDKTEQTTPAPLETKKFKSTLLKSEQAYQHILDIDELNKKMPTVPDEKRKELEEDCKAKLHSLYHIVEETWSSFIPIRKGRSLILRTLAVVDKPSSRSLFDRLLSSLGPFIKKELTDPVSLKCVKGMNGVLQTCDMSSLLLIASHVTPHLKSAVKTSFGCYLILHSIKQAEKIFSAFVELSEELKQSWFTFVSNFLSMVEKSKSLPKLRSMPVLAYDHLGKQAGSAAALTRISHWFKHPHQPSQPQQPAG